MILEMFFVVSTKFYFLSLVKFLHIFAILLLEFTSAELPYIRIKNIS